MMWKKNAHNHNNWFQNFFSYMFASWITDRNKEKCTQFKDAITLIGSLAVSTLGLFGALKSHWLLLIALLVIFVTMAIFFGMQHVISLIDNAERTQLEDLSAKLTDLTNELSICTEKCHNLEDSNEYLTSLQAETKLLAKAIQKANSAKTSRGLYSKTNNSIVQMILVYLGIQKSNFSVHIYAYDGETRMVRRVDVESFVQSKQAADENFPKPITDPNIKDRYYAKSILSNKVFFILPDTKSIKEHLVFPDDDIAIVNQYSQYVAMVYKVGSNVKLYIEVIAYNGLMLGKTTEDLQKFAKKVLSPFSSLLALVDWSTIRRDCNE